MSKRKRCSAPGATPRKSLKTSNARTKSPPDNTVQHDFLYTVYSNVQSLRQYILDRLPPTSRARRKRVAAFDAEWPAHAGFLDVTLIGILQTPSDEVRSSRARDFQAFTQTQRSTSIPKSIGDQCDVEEVLGFVIWQLFQKNPQSTRRPDHLLCHGYEKVLSVHPNEQSIRPVTLPGIFAQWPNDNVETLKASPWPQILSLLGNDFESIFSSLLFDCGIFLALNSGKQNLFQLSGQPIFNINKSRDQKPVGLLFENGVQNYSISLRKPGQITLVRNRMFYARASVSRNGLVKLGLKHIHALNRYQKLDTEVHRLHLMQYMFPQQFGMHNVFASNVNPMETTQPWKDYTVRDEEIEQYSKRCRNRTPKRMRAGVKDLVAKIITNHQRCSYTQLLYHYSQSHLPTQSRHGQKLISTLSTKPQLEAVDSSHPTDEQSTAAGTSFTLHATPQNNVSSFCRAILQHLLPADAFGIGEDGFHNWSGLLGLVDRFITARRFESFTLHEVAHNMKVTSIDWLRPANVRKGQKLSITDRRKRLELLHEFLYYVFDSLLIPIIRSNFYVTETAVHRNRLFYFRHDIWKKISEPALMTLRLNMFEPLNARKFRHAAQFNKLGYSQVRLLPKEHGARPITNLRRRPTILNNGKRMLGTSINARLAPSFAVFNFERKRQPEAIASALFSVGDIGRKLKEYQGRHAGAVYSGARHLYFVKMDIKSCFDTIPQGQLLDLAQTILQEDDYRVTKFVESKKLPLTRKGDKTCLTSKFVPKASEQAFESAFSVHEAENFGERKSRVLFTGTDHHRIIRTNQIKQLLKDHIQDNIVRIGRRHFRQNQGIPQGSVLSSLLCSFFYARFEREKLSFLDFQSSLLLRLIDDFLLITTDKDQAHRFVNAMSEGYAEYGISINAEKSLVNFEACVQGHKISRVHGTEYFPYCGLGIHMKSLELNKDRQRKDVHVENALTIDISGRAVTCLQRRILTALKIQMHAMLLDVSHNSPAQIMTTLFSCYVEAMMKMHRYRINLPRSKRPGCKFVISLCHQMLTLGHQLLHNLPTNDYASTKNISVHRIGSQAMLEVLSRKQTEYRAVVSMLQGMQFHMQRKTQSRREGLDSIARGGIAPFQNYMY